jgi:hypothetical protein
MQVSQFKPPVTSPKLVIDDINGSYTTCVSLKRITQGVYQPCSFQDFIDLKHLIEEHKNYQISNNSRFISS